MKLEQRILVFDRTGGEQNEIEKWFRRNLKDFNVYFFKDREKCMRELKRGRNYFNVLIACYSRLEGVEDIRWINSLQENQHSIIPIIFFKEEGWEESSRICTEMGLRNILIWSEAEAGKNYYRNLIRQYIKRELQILKLEEKKDAMRKLMQSNEEQYDVIMDNLSELVFITDMSGSITYVNSACMEILGYEPDEMVGQLFDSFCMPEQSSTVRELMQDMLRGREPLVHMADFMTKSGEKKNLQFCLIPLKSPEEDIQGVMGTVIDLTELVRACATYNESRHMFYTLSEHVSEAVALINGEKFIFVNSQWANLTGYSKETFLFTFRFETLVEDGSLDQVRREINDLLIGKRMYSVFRFNIKTRHAGSKFCECTALRTEYAGQAAIILKCNEISDSPLYDFPINQESDRGPEPINPEEYFS